MPTILGVNFGGGGLEILEKHDQTICRKHLLRISLRNSPAIFLKFAGPKLKIHPRFGLQNLGIKNFALQKRGATKFRPATPTSKIAYPVLPFLGFLGFPW